MIVSEPRKINPDVEHEISALLRSGVDYDLAIRRMRGFNLNKIECIKLLRDHAGIKTGRAKDIVHLSPAWADRYESDEALHDVAEQALRMSDEEGDALLAEEERTAA